MDKLLYMKFLNKMNDEQVTAVWEACHEAGLIEAAPDNAQAEPDTLAALLQKVSHVDVVLACGAVPDSFILETLMGQPLSKDFPKTSQEGGVRGAKGTRVKAEKKPKSESTLSTAPVTDDRIIATVAPNPKKPSSKSFARYALYTVGISVADFISLGGLKADVKYDSEHSFITLSDRVI